MFDQAIIYKVEKANRYATEPSRIRVSAVEADFHGDNNDHHVILGPSGWQCHSCNFFDNHGTCAHILTMQKLMERMLPEERRFEFFDESAN